MSGSTLCPETLALVRDAAQWRLLGLLLECPVGEWLDQLGVLAAEVDDQQLREAVPMAREEASEGLYHTTFGPGGPAMPREVGYRQTVHPGRFLGELRSLYASFGYVPVTSEAPDHVAVEAGFVAFLRLKEAYARSIGDDRLGGDAARAVELLLDEHLSLIAQPLARALQHSGIEYLRLATAWLAARVGPPRTVAQPSQPLELLTDGCCQS